MSFETQTQGDLLSAEHPDCYLAETADLAKGVAIEAIEATRVVQPEAAIGWCANQICRLRPDAVRDVQRFTDDDAVRFMPTHCAMRSPVWNKTLVAYQEVTATKDVE